MRRTIRVAGGIAVAAGLALLLWAGLVWRWQDPFTYLLMHREQGRLAERYEARARVFAVRRPASSDGVARTYRRRLRVGDPIGRLRVPRLGLDVVVVYGTDTQSLRKGPGLEPRTRLPGEGGLIYVAGHRTTYGAPFSHIDDLRRGDPITFELPYGRFRYAVSGRRIVDAGDVAILRSGKREQLALQACWPRFFASQRIVVYARPVGPGAAGAPGPSRPSVAAR